MPRDYWGQFLKDSDKVFRDANGIIKRNYQTLADNVRKEAVRMTERVDCLNRMRELEKTLQDNSKRGRPLDEKDRKFREMMETVHRMVDSLQNCSPMLAENPNVNPGALEGDATKLEQDRHLLREQINAFRQLIEPDNTAYAPHQACLNQVDGILQRRLLRTICLEVRNVIDRGDVDQIKQYGSLAGTLIQQFDSMISVLNWELSNVEEGNQLIPGEDNNYGNNNVL